MRRIGQVDQDKEEMYGKDQMEDGMEEEMVDKEEMLDKGQGGGDQGGQGGHGGDKNVYGRHTYMNERE